MEFLGAAQSSSSALSVTRQMNWALRRSLTAAGWRRGQCWVRNLEFLTSPFQHILHSHHRTLLHYFLKVFKMLGVSFLYWLQLYLILLGCPEKFVWVLRLTSYKKTQTNFLANQPNSFTFASLYRYIFKNIFLTLIFLICHHWFLWT